MRRVRLILGGLGLFLLPIALLLIAQLTCALLMMALRLDQGSIAGGLFWSAWTIGIVQLGVYLLRRFGQKRPMASLGFTFPPNWGRQLGAGLLAGGLGMLAVLGAEMALGWAHYTQLPDLPTLLLRTLPGMLAGLLIALSPGYTEELLFRGLLIEGLDRLMPQWLSALLPAILFGLAHVGSGGFGPTFVLSAILFALFQTWVCRRTGTLWWAVGHHTAWNWLQTSLGLNHPGSSDPTSPGILVQTGPEWAVGGAPAIEGGLLVFGAGFAVVALMGWLFVRRESERVAERVAA